MRRLKNKKYTASSHSKAFWWNMARGEIKTIYRILLFIYDGLQV